jgi:hypothetical protein
MPWEVDRLDGEQLDIVIRARRAAQREQARLIAVVVAEMRNLWSEGPRWTADQVIGDAPPPQASRSNDVAAIMSLEEEARALREEEQRRAAKGWADSFAVADADLAIDDSAFGAAGEEP